MMGGPGIHRAARAAALAGVLALLLGPCPGLAAGAVVDGMPGAVPGQAVVETALRVAPESPSRLVLAYWPAQGWVVRQEGRQVELALPGAALDVAPPALPPAAGSHVQAVSVERRPDATYLRLTLDCDCTIAVQGDGRRMAIDVVGADLAAGPIYAEAGPAPRLAPQPVLRPVAAGLVAPVVPRPRDSARAEAERIEKTRDRLLDELRAAAEQGLVSLRPDATAGAGPSPADGAAEIAEVATPEAPVQAAQQPPPAPVAPPPPGALAGAGAPQELPGSHGEAPAMAAGPALSEPLPPRLAPPELVPPALVPPALAPPVPAAPAPPQPGTETAGPRPDSLIAESPAPELPAPESPAPESAAPESAALESAPPESAPPESAAGEFPALGRPAPVIPPSDGPAPGMAVPGSGYAEAVEVATEPMPEPVCLPNEALLLPDPMEPRTLLREVASLRQGLLGEFDRPDPEVVGRLARLYIAHGMGAEARALVATLGVTLPDRALLMALGRLVMNRPLARPNVLGASGCTGQHALWQALDEALAGHSRAAVQHEAAATGALEQMTRGVRGKVAVRVGLAAAALDDRIAVHRLLAMARRSVSGAAPDDADWLLLLEAEDDRLGGNRARRIAILERLRTHRSDGGAMAVLDLGELAIAGTWPGPGRDPAAIDNLLTDLGDLALTHRGSPLGQAAAIAEVRLTGHSLGRDLGMAVLDLARRNGTVTEPAYLSTLTELSELPGVPGRAELALVYEANPGRFAESIEARAFRRALAQSYTRLGAPRLARRMLRAGDLEGGALTGEIARAELALGDPAAALELVRLLPDGPERSGIEAGAALAKGQYADALGELIAARAPAEARAAAAWGARDWPAAVAALREEDGGDGNGDGEARAAAARFAYAALQAGRDTAPTVLRDRLATDPQTLGGVEAMFLRLPEPGGGAPVPAEVPAFTKRLNQETLLLENLLDDG